MWRRSIYLATRARRSLTNAAPTAASSSSTATTSSAAASASADATAELLTFAPSLLQFACLTAFAQNYVLSVMQCVGPSMLPTLGLSGDVVLMWPTASGLITPQLGDVVICSSPTDPTSTVCKRVVGLPGDVVKYKRLPGMPELRETRPAHSRDGGRKSRECIQQVPRGQVWLQGDNSADSCDSRYYGPVPMALVRGIVFVKLWPFTEAGVVSRTIPIEKRRGFVEQEQREAEAAVVEEEEVVEEAILAARSSPPAAPAVVATDESVSNAYRRHLVGAEESNGNDAAAAGAATTKVDIVGAASPAPTAPIPATAAANSAAGPVVHPANR